jgi:gamma-glutamylcyclotransferase
MKTIIFVYGTLRQNYHNHAYLNTANFLGEAKTQDKFVMHFNGRIPFVSESQSISQIMGEVYEVDDLTLARLDELEGCYPISNNPIRFDSESWYIRKQVAVKITGTDNMISVWMYFNESANHHSIISSGDYKEHDKLPSVKDRVWYFAYGSNMDVAQMLTRKAPFTRIKRGRVYGQRLVFNKIADRYPGYGYANIVSEHGFEVIGVLYEVNEAGLLKLDECEGVSSNHYFRSQIMVLLDDGTSVEATVYLAHPDKIKDGLLPTKAYMEHLYKGLDILGDEGKAYLDQALIEARVTDDPRFLTDSDIPLLDSEEELANVKDYALPVLINGHKAKIYYYECTWSTRLVFFCEPEEVIHFEAMNLGMDEHGYFRSKYFHFVRRGILMFREQRVIIEFDK